MSCRTHYKVWLMAIIVAVTLSGCNDIARFEGNQAASHAELEFVVRRPLAQWQEKQRAADLIDAAEAIRSRLDYLGYVWAEVDGRPPANAVKDPLPVFIIREGPRVRLQSVSFSYQPPVPDEQHAHLLGDSDLKLISRLDKWYTTATINDAPSRIVRALRLKGFLLAKVSAPAVAWSSEKNIANVSFSINSGPQFTLTSETLIFSGEDNLRTELTALLDKKGAICHPRLGAESAARLRNYLANHGYRQAVVDGKQKIDADTSTVSIELTVDPGPQNIVKEITSVGRKRTSASFFKHHLRDIKVGEPLSQEKLDVAMSSLTLTGIFRQVKDETTVAEADADNKAPTEVTIKLKENNTYHVDLMAGYGSYEQLRGGIEFVDEHLFGRGLRFNTGVNASFKSWGGDVGLSDPYLLGPGRRIGTNLVYSERELPSFYRQETSASVGVSQRLRPVIDPASYEARMTYEFKRSEDLRISAPIPGEEIGGYYITSSIGTNIRRDTRGPKIVDPDSGTYSQVGVVFSAKPIGAEVEYFEVNAKWSGAYSPAQWMVGTLHVAGRTRDPFDSESLPIGERLFMGGEDTVRSFTKDDLGPRDTFGDPIGGLTNAVANIEFRFRPYLSHSNFEIATFYDIGMVDPNPWSINDVFGQAVGIGLRYRTPVGPIRLDGAYNPGNRMGAKHPWAIHLAVGFAF